MQLKKVELIPQPNFTKNQKPKGLRARGVRFEHRCVEECKEIPGYEVIHGPWFSYETIEGVKGICQPDILLIHQSTENSKRPLNVLVECKLSVKVRAAKQKLLEFYMPIVEYYYGKSFVPVQMVRHLKLGTKACTLSELPKLQEYSVIHMPLT